MDWATYLEKTRVGEQTMFMLGWTGDNGDPDNFLATLLDKNNINGNNNTRWANEEAHQLMMKAKQAPTQAEREQLYLAARANVVDYLPHPKGSESLEKVDIK
jgi:peptide/nickel transport system substrate-binding protein